MGKASASALYVAFCGAPKRMVYTIVTEALIKQTLRIQLYMEEKFQKRSM